MALLGRIGVEASERSFFVRAGLCLMLLGASASALQNTAETLFLKRVGVEHLPVAFLICSVILIGGTAVVGRVLAAVDRPSWLPWVLAALGTSLVPVWALVFADLGGILWALLVLVELIEAVGLLAFWVTLGDVVTPRQAKRLFAPLAAGATIGRLLGSFATQPAALLVGIEGVVLIAAGLQVLAGVAVLGLARAAGEDSEADVSRDEATPKAVSARRRGPRFGRIWSESRLFRLLVIWSFCAGALGPMIYFQFSYAVNAATAGENGEQALIALYSQFRGWLYTAILLTQLGFSTSLFRRFGIPLTSAFWPLAFLGGFLWLGLAMSLTAALSTIAVIRLEGNAIAKPGIKILHNLLPERLRSAATSWTEGPVSHLGAAIGNGLVMGAMGLWGAAMVSVPAIPIALVWVVAAVALWRLYPGLLLQAASTHRLRANEVQLAELLDPATLRALAKGLSSPDPDICRAAAELMGGADPAQATRVLAEAVEVATAATRAVLTDALQGVLEATPPGEIRDPVASAALARLLAKREELPPDQRADLLQVYARLTGGATPELGSESVLDSALGDPEAAARLAAMAELQRRQLPPPGMRDLDAALARAFESGDVLMRRTARKELRALLLTTPPDRQWEQQLALLSGGLVRRVDRASVAESLVEVAKRHAGPASACAEEMLRYIGDPDPRVRAAVLLYVGHCGLEDYCETLVSRLSSQYEVEVVAAEEGLEALGQCALRPLQRALTWDEGPLGDRILDSLVKIGIDPGELVVLQDRVLTALRADAIRLAALWPDEADPVAAQHHLVLRRLGERVEEGLRAYLSLHGGIEGDARVAELGRQLQASGDPHTRAILIEAIESLLGAVERRKLLPLLETSDPLERGRLAAAAMACEAPSREGAWAELSGDADALLRRLQEALPPPWLESARPMGDTEEMSAMDATQIAAVLQHVPGFERLSTRQLVRVAEAATELRFSVGDALCEEGQEGSALFVLVEGQVTLSAGGQLLERLGPGSLLAELSALDGGLRSESILAESDLRVLRISRSDLIALMTEAPGLGLGLSQVLALRIRALHDRLAQGAAA